MLTPPLLVNAVFIPAVIFRMLSAKAQYSLRNAKEYFEEHLRVGDYYSEGQRVLGEWYGQGVEMLGLSGVPQGEKFVRLCENLHPQTGERLTLRQKTTRRETGQDGEEHENANRRVFYDFTFSPPKSVSIAARAPPEPRPPWEPRLPRSAFLTQNRTKPRPQHFIIRIIRKCYSHFTLF
jgi:hypothetical protein